MTDESDKSKNTEREDDATKGAGNDLREGLAHLFSAARTVVKSAEPTLNNAMDEGERVIEKLGRGGSAVATEVGKEVATFAARLAERLKAVAGRIDGEAPDKRTPPAPPAANDAHDANDANDDGSHKP